MEQKGVRGCRGGARGRGARRAPVACRPQCRGRGYGLPVIGRCNYRPVITAVITVITTALFQLPVIGQDKPSVRVPSPADTRAAARQSHLQGHVTEEMALTAPR